MNNLVGCPQTGEGEDLHCNLRTNHAGPQGWRVEFSRRDRGGPPRGGGDRDRGPPRDSYRGDRGGMGGGGGGGMRSDMK